MNIEVNYIEPYALSHTAYEHLLEFEVSRLHNPNVNLNINDPNYIKTVYGYATRYKGSHPFWLLIYGGSKETSSFEDWYGF